MNLDTNTVNTPQPEAGNSQFSINRWFNEHPIRIIGTPTEPFFYATDLAAILGIKNVSTSISSFTDDDIVTPEQRERYGIVTYQKYGGTMRPNPTVILLTEYGAYKLIIHSRSLIAKSFQKFIYDLMRKARLSELEQLRITNQNNIDTLNVANRNLTNRLQVYETVIPIIYVFKRVINGNPYDFIPESDVDEYFRSKVDDQWYIDNPVKTLYKMTYCPLESDFLTYKLYAKVFGVAEHVFIGVNDYDNIPVNEAASKYCRYFTEKPDLLDIEGVKVSYQ
jgi:prophage antirepressor-like protein